MRQVCLRINGAVHELIAAEFPLSRDVRPAVYYQPYFPSLPPAAAAPIEQLPRHEGTVKGGQDQEEKMDC